MPGADLLLTCPNASDSGSLQAAVAGRSSLSGSERSLFMLPPEWQLDVSAGMRLQLCLGEAGSDQVTLAVLP